MSVVSLLSATACNLRAVENSTVSLIADIKAGPAVSHGAAKVRLALEAKGIEVELTTSLEDASGAILIVGGTTEGAGPAGKLLTARNLT